MQLKLYVIHGSPPCAAIEKALALKGLAYDKVEWPPPLHAAIQWLTFGARTVPALKLSGNGGLEKISGSRAIMRRLEQLEPDPPLFPADPGLRAAVVDAETWGDEVLQPLCRTLVWRAMLRSPDAMVSYSEGSRLPLPAGAIRLLAPGIARVERVMNDATEDAARRDLQALPGFLDRIDAWIAARTIGDAARPNAADLQIFSVLRLLMTLADVRPMLGARPCAGVARALFEAVPGEMPAGSLPTV